ncbi:hypothetical protein RKE29_01520 [Streptomyces sp. B1866]|uniref:hypothetical protein n=1 Tax=Streptomyces sp. B1866 TaxID=3075431 RepID=UPI0028912556|nr:hypothetical protein [Streptomyces sp. B1866]MDT3395339.1 hypothetical protein [Streptomyces sp. B1866]
MEKDLPGKRCPASPDRDVVGPGGAAAEPTQARPPNETTRLYVRGSGDLDVGSGGFGNTGIVQIIIKDARTVEEFSSMLVGKLAEVVSSLDFDTRQLGRLPAPGSEVLRGIQVERDQLRSQLDRAEEHLKRARADLARANRMRQVAANPRADVRPPVWSQRATPEVRKALKGWQKHIMQPLPLGEFLSKCEDAQRVLSGILDANARDLDLLWGLEGPPPKSRGKHLAMALLGMVVIAAVIIVVIVATRSSPGWDERGIPEPTTTTSADTLSPSNPPPTSMTPTTTPPPTPSPTKDDGGSVGERGGKGGKTNPSPSPSPSPPWKSSSTPSQSQEPVPPSPTGAKQITVVRGHENEMSIYMTGFEPDKDVVIYAYTDTDATSGPYGQTFQTIKADGTRRFGAFPMKAYGQYWVVAEGVKSNAYNWTGR